MPRLDRLAMFYAVPIEQLLPREVSGSEADAALEAPVNKKLAIDVVKLVSAKGAPFEMLSRYLRLIQVQRQDFNGRVHHGARRRCAGDRVDARRPGRPGRAPPRRARPAVQAGLTRRVAIGALPTAFVGRGWCDDRSGCTSTSRSARRSATTARSRPGPIGTICRRRTSAAVRTEIDRAVDDGMPVADTIFVGGGTPTLVPPDALAELIAIDPGRRRGRGDGRVQSRRRHGRHDADVPSRRRQSGEPRRAVDVAARAGVAGAHP